MRHIGLLLDVVDEATISSEVTAATSYTAGGSTYLALLTNSGTEMVVLWMDPTDRVDRRVHSGPPGTSPRHS
ncbi:MAG: hypothetical protein ACRDSR_25735 [Pseudonocardiaceae bacterium]